ncbi:hypothetical protein HY02_02020 [Peptococcaceae bacterium SCADC1_2_3]|nr:hypothetical protein HY02_02020 [Peptococcaceae bacterium SCADC1_2_3]
MVKPGARPETIKLAYQGIEGLELAPGGELLIKTAAGNLKEAKPDLYQEIAGEKVTVEGSFALAEGEKTAYGFAVAAHDSRYPLVIDPLLYSTYLGGSDLGYGYGITVDGSGNAYVTGWTESTNFPTTSGAFDQSHNGGDDAFVTKLNAAGSALVYSTYLGGSDWHLGSGIAVDSSDCAYVTGYTSSTDFPTTSGAFGQTHNGDYDAFVTKLYPGPVTFGTTVGNGQITVPGNPGFAQFVFDVVCWTGQSEPKGMLIYKDPAGKVNFRSEKITGLVFDFANQKAVFKGTAKSPAGAIQAAAFKVEVEDHNGAGNDLFKIWLYDKNNVVIYHEEGPLKLGNIRLLASGY